jgi:PEP-CTERM motif
MQSFNFVAATILGTSLSVSLAAGIPAAQAMSLIPQKEGEIKLTNANCVASTCINTETEFGYKVTSLGYDLDPNSPNYGLSRLFVDKNSTANDWGSGIKFKTIDAGTNPTSSEYWLRPVAYKANSPTASPTGTPAEEGQLEIGRFKFEFAQVLSELTLELFDIEDAYKTGILEVNGTPLTKLLDKGPDGNIQSLVLKNVSSFVIQLGNPGPNSVFGKTGDGVRMTGLAASVPEPTTTLGLGALAVAGMFGLRQRKKVSL